MQVCEFEPSCLQGQQRVRALRAGRQPVKDLRGGKARFEGPLSLVESRIIYGGRLPCDR